MVVFNLHNKSVCSATRAVGRERERVRGGAREKRGVYGGEMEGTKEEGREGAPG